MHVMVSVPVSKTKNNIELKLSKQIANLHMIFQLLLFKATFIDWQFRNTLISQNLKYFVPRCRRKKRISC